MCYKKSMILIILLPILLTFKNKLKMKINKIYTLFFLLFTISALSSCVTSPTKTTTSNKVSQQEPTATIKKVDANGFKAEVEGKKVQLVDVRTPGEYKQGHIENAENHNVFDKNFMEQMAKYKKDQPIYVYCRSGGRSMKAANMLKSKGYNVVNLNGGFNGWVRSGFKSVK